MARSIKKGPFVDDHLSKKVGCGARDQRQAADQDLVAPLDDHARVRRAHDRRAQRQAAYPGLRVREHGRPQARRVRADAHLQGPFGRQEGRGAAAGEEVRETAMETNAILRGVRLSAQKGRLVADQIRGLPVDQALNILSVQPEEGRRHHQEGAASRRSPTPSTTTAPMSTSSRSRRSYVDKAENLRRFTRAREGPWQRHPEADVPHPCHRRRRQIRKASWDRKYIRPDSASPSRGTGRRSGSRTASISRRRSRKTSRSAST